MWSWLRRIARRKGADRPEPIPIEAAAAWPVGEECAAFLLGGYAGYLESVGATVPLWARLNSLCHLSEDGLGELSRNPGAGDQAWAAATAYLAEEILCAAARYGTSVADIQRFALQPLELRLAATPQRGTPRPHVLVRTVVRALQEYPSMPHPIG
ncbi:MAG TPA: hypothetical protein VE152_02920 [Acidimicrobiales bacterium]|jgi:hypothetical protein|nr:hypothetical protein [Acidimicrobiales bacterium]